MKPIWILLLGLCALTRASAQQPPLPGFYFGLDAGASFLEDAELEELLGPVLPGTEIEFEPGFRFGIELGYDITDWLSADLEVAFAYNGIDSITGADEVDAGLLSMPMFINARIHLPVRKVWISPFVGAGVGGVAMNLSIDDIDYRERSFWGDASGVCFSVQGLAGVQFNLSENISLSLEYRYLHMFSPDLEIDTGVYWNIQSDEIRLGDLQAHMISIAYQYRF